MITNRSFQHSVYLSVGSAPLRCRKTFQTRRKWPGHFEGKFRCESALRVFKSFYVIDFGSNRTGIYDFLL